MLVPKSLERGLVFVKQFREEVVSGMQWMRGGPGAEANGAEKAGSRIGRQQDLPVLPRADSRGPSGIGASVSTNWLFILTVN